MKKFSIYTSMGIAIVIFILILLMLCPWFIIKDIQIEGIKNINRDYIVNTLKLDKSTNLFAFNSFSAKLKMKKNNYVEDIKIKKEFPSTLKIQIVEKKVFGYIPYINDFIYIGKDGEVLDVQSSYTEKLPIIIGLNFDFFSIGKKLNVENEEKLNFIASFTSIFYEKNLLQDIVKIDVSNIEDIHLYINKVDVILGDFDDLNAKINILIEILSKIDTNERGFLYINDINKNPIFRYIS